MELFLWFGIFLNWYGGGTHLTEKKNKKKQRTFSFQHLIGVIMLFSLEITQNVT